MRKNSIFIAFLMLLLPSTIFAIEEVKTGYDLYHNLKLMENPQNTDDVTAALFAIGYLKGLFDGLIIMQDMQYNNMFSPEIISEAERSKISKELKFYRLDTPKEGIAVGQLILIYNNFAKTHPKELSNTARTCVLRSLIETYGWK